MALTNAEKQKRWRDRRNALAKLGEQQQQRRVELRNQGGLTAQLDPLFDELFRQGLTNAATVSIGTVKECAIKLERALVAHGVVAPSRRTENPTKYERSIRAKEAIKERERWKQVRDKKQRRIT